MVWMTMLVSPSLGSAIYSQNALFSASTTMPDQQSQWQHQAKAAALMDEAINSSIIILVKYGFWQCVQGQETVRRLGVNQNVGAYSGDAAWANDVEQFAKGGAVP